MDQKSGKVTQIAYPCAACKILRRKCGEKCLLAPYFPPDNPWRFIIPHKMFGASNMLKIIRDVEPENREDAVNSIVYEATERLRDPVYGCTGIVCQLQKQISELQSQIATTEAELRNAQANLESFSTGYRCKEEIIPNQFDMSRDILQEIDTHEQELMVAEDEVESMMLWQQLWT